MNDSPGSAPSSSLPDETAVRPTGRRRAAAAVAAIVIVIAGVLGFRHWRFVTTHAETDDAEMENDVSPVLPRVPGYVARVLVRDNDRVAAGQTLVEIDPHDLELRVASSAAALESARAALKTAEADVANARAAAAVARAELVTARVQRDKAASDLARDRNLFSGAAITDRQLSDSQAAADTAAAQAEASAQRAEAAAAQVAVAESRARAAEAAIGEREADLNFSRLQRSYATVTAPIAGLVSHKNVEPGEFVEAGQTLLSIASESAPWIVANFKETQLSKMRAGQPAEFTVDAYRGVSFRGRVDSIAGATGARFALLPPDNATGNFVKVTQRVPVKIVLTDPPDPTHPLLAGLSVDVAVDITADAAR